MGTGDRVDIRIVNASDSYPKYQATYLSGVYAATEATAGIR
jgi:hypothetical protein